MEQFDLKPMSCMFHQLFCNFCLDRLCDNVLLECKCVKCMMCIDIINVLAYLIDRWWSEVQCNSDGSRQYIYIYTYEVKFKMLSLP